MRRQIRIALKIILVMIFLCSEKSLVLAKSEPSEIEKVIMLLGTRSGLGLDGSKKKWVEEGKCDDEQREEEHLWG